jgi:hypothetical protein
MAKKVNFSDGDYKYREDAKTFQKEFYYVNFYKIIYISYT